MNTPQINTVLATLEGLVLDLRRRTEEAEARAAAAEERVALERQAREAELSARREAEARAVRAERGAEDALRRAEAAEGAARARSDELHRDLLAATRRVLDAGAELRSAAADVARDRGRAQDHDQPGRTPPEPDGPRMSPPSVPRSLPLPPAEYERGRGDAYAWLEDEPPSPWWSRVFRRRRY
jgi:hypothetical protein